MLAPDPEANAPNRSGVAPPDPLAEDVLNRSGVDYGFSVLCPINDSASLIANAPDPEANAPNLSGVAGLCGSSHCHVVPPDPLVDHVEANVLKRSGVEDLFGSSLSGEDADELAQKAYRCHMKRLGFCQGRGKGRQKAAHRVEAI